jgi:hypothetical protein
MLTHVQVVSEQSYQMHRLDAYRRPKPKAISLASSGLPSMKRSGRKDPGSSYISGFWVIALYRISDGRRNWWGLAGKHGIPYICHHMCAFGDIITFKVVGLRQHVGKTCRAYIRRRCNKASHVTFLMEEGGATWACLYFRTEGLVKDFWWPTGITLSWWLQSTEENHGLQSRVVVCCQ